MHASVARRFCVVAVVLAVSAFSISCKNRGGEEPTVAANSDGSTSAGAPSAAELEAYVTGAGRLRFGMTESEVTAALGKGPARRADEKTTGASFTDLAWDVLEGPRPGGVLGRFVGGKLVMMEIASTKLELPRVDRATAESLTRVDIVRRSVAKTLRMKDIEAVTGSRGYRGLWRIVRPAGTQRVIVVSRWFWEVEPGGQALSVEEEDGVAGQPVIVKMR